MSDKFEAVEVIGKRIKNGQLDYLVRFADNCKKEPSWVSVKNLSNVMELASQFEYRILCSGEQLYLNKDKELVYQPEVVLNDSEQFRNQYEPQLDLLERQSAVKILRCHRDKKTDEPYFLVQWHTAFGQMFYNQNLAMWISGEKLKKRDPKILAEYLLHHLRMNQ